MNNLYILDIGHAFEKHGAFFFYFEFFHSETCYGLTKDGRTKFWTDFVDLRPKKLGHYDCPPPSSDVYGR